MPQKSWFDRLKENYKAGQDVGLLPKPEPKREEPKAQAKPQPQKQPPQKKVARKR